MSLNKSTVLLFLSATLAGALFQFGSPSLFDGYFYSKMAQFFLRYGLLQDFPWIFFGTPHGNFSGNHFLFYVLASPFAYLHPVWGMKLFASLIFGLLSATFFFLLDRQVPRYLAYSGTFLLVISSAEFTGRMNQIRPLSVAVLMTLLIVHLLLRRQLVALFFSLLVFVWLYDGAIIALVPLAFWASLRYLMYKHADWALLGAGLGGVAAGLLLHPYFPKNITSSHLLSANPLLNTKLLHIGEWQPIYMQGWGILTSLPLLVFVLGVIAFWQRRKIKDMTAVFFLLLSLTFFLLMLARIRFVDFFVPFSLLFTLPQLHPYLEKLRSRKIQAAFFRDRFILIPGLVIIALTVSLSSNNIYKLYRYSTSDNDQAKTFRPAADYLLKNSPTAAIVLNLPWSSFDGMFYLNEKNYYVAGLNPLFLYHYDQKTYWVWWHLENDQLLTCPQEDCSSLPPDQASTPYQAAAEIFSAEYLLIKNSGFPKLKAYLDNNPNFSPAVQTSQITLYLVKHPDSKTIQGSILKTINDLR